MASFFLLSLALHAVALVFPVAFLEAKREDLIPVVILATAEDTAGAGDQSKKSGEHPARAAAKWPQRKAQIAQNIVDPNPSLDQRNRPAESAADSIVSDDASPVVTPSTLAETHSFGKITSLAPGGNSSDNDAAGGNAKGRGASESGAGLGDGQGSSGNGLKLIQARYSETPKPVYPESARSEGREGRVLLRVLVDDQGRTKRVEVNDSSGSEALDRAAAEAIKRWRFIPARYGDKTVESWIRVPIDFSLADNKSW
jgi:protein TonB